MGSVQRSIADAFSQEPDRRFTIDELAERTFPTETIDRRHKESIRRAVKALAPQLGLTTSRAALPERFGWRYLVGRKTT